jgi:carboxylesterase
VTSRTGVLLLHGLTGMPSEMRPLERHLRRLGCIVDVPLLPGHGATHRELLATGWRDWVEGARRATAPIDNPGTVTLPADLLVP